MHVLILGTRGIPANHGGFETFAERFALYLTDRGHEVTVYCQAGGGPVQSVETWRGIRLVRIRAGDGAVGTIEFDLKSTLHAVRENGIVLTLGYNTAILGVIYRLFGKKHLMNMDGVEWKRAKWSPIRRLWLWANEWFGARLANHLIADHPEIASHLARHTALRKITMIPYGADEVVSADVARVEKFELDLGNYFLLIARPEPENSVLEVVRAFSRSKRGAQLVILGNYGGSSAYHQQVLAAAGPEVKFLGAIYDSSVVESLRYYAKAYVHGHRVGGTNPSLVESLAAGNPVIAHDNPFNRWVAGAGAQFFSNEDQLEEILMILQRGPALLKRMSRASCERHRAYFSNEAVFTAYEKLLLEYDRGEVPDIKSDGEAGGRRDPGCTF